MAKSTRKINLPGRWEVARCFIKRGQAEGTLQVFDPEAIIWEFLPKGHFTEQIAGGGRFETGYAYDPQSKNLQIDRRDFEPDGVLWTRREEVYHLVPVSDTELYLYDFETTDPEDSVFRHILLRRLR